jgi:hypothetical protein
MNKYQREISKGAKTIKNKTGFPWSCCKWVARRRTNIDIINLWG